MVYCGPSCTIPSFASRPVVGFGSGYGLGCGYGGYSGYGGYGGYGSYGGYGGYGGYGYGAEHAANLGILPGVQQSCISQLPQSEIVLQPPPINVTIPGAVLSASCEPIAVGGNTACAVGSYGYGGLGGYGLGGYGYGLGGYGYGLGRYGQGYGRGLYGYGSLGRRSLLSGSRIYGCYC
ncbi:shematrin-like protein 2 [Lacerta agilis]|uniref:shematrin-like protein 2 n=1 Tax=Lacerta agilis TaxID=80427 RepID=UPI001419B0E2|nr:shematrin-like protein 2 [Lacerta agilis]